MEEALDYLVPMLWDAANRIPQPTSGYLPETVVLTEIANRLEEAGILAYHPYIVMKALGPNGAANTNMIALGDSIPALEERAGFDTDARRLGLEVLRPTRRSRIQK